MTAILLECKPACKHVFQDEKYNGKRVFNKTTASDGKVYRCTVCGEEKTFGASKDEEKKRKK
jgi:hypothetical protein